MKANTLVDYYAELFITSLKSFIVQVRRMCWRERVSASKADRERKTHTHTEAGWREKDSVEREAI